LVIVGNRDIPDGTAPEIEKCPVFTGEDPGPVQNPPCFFSNLPENEDTGTEIHAAEFRSARVYRADPFIGSLLPEEWAGKGFFIPLL
jgi:hypothetical protein